MHSRHSRHSRHSYRAWLAAAAALASITTMVGIPLAAAPASATTDTWTAAGPGTVKVLSTGAGDSNPSFSYWYCAVTGVAPGATCNDGGADPGTPWTFQATASGETQVTGTYLWTGNHAWCAAFAELQPFTVTGGVTTRLPAVVNEGNNCLGTDGEGPIDGSFEFSAQYTFDLSGVSQYGFLLSGSNGDYNSFLQGTFTFETASPQSPPVDLVATPGNGVVNLSWTAPTGGSPSGYLVFEGTTPRGEIPDPVATVSGTTLTAQVHTVSEAASDSPPQQTLTNGTPYYFTVVAVYGTPVFGYTGTGSSAPALASPPSNEASATPAAINSATLLASSPTVAGVETVRSSVIPTSAVGSTSSGPSGAASIQLGSIQLGSSQLGSIQLGSIPLGPIYNAGTASDAPSGLQAAAQTLSSSLLSDIGITYPQGCSGSSCTGWAGILAGSIYANVPLEAVTLADVLMDTSTGTGGQDSPADAFNSVNLASLNLASSQLGSIQLGSIQLGSIQLGSIGLAGSTPGSDALAAWCTALAGLNPPVDCSNFGITDNGGSYTNTDGVTLLTLALAGVQLGSIQLGSIQLGSIQLGSIQLGSIQLGSINLQNNALLQIPIGSIPDLVSTQLGSIQLGSIQLGSIQLGSIQLGSIQLGSIQLGSIQLGSIQLGSIQLGSIGSLSGIVNCSGSFTCSSTATLQAAYNAGAIIAGATLPVADLTATVLDSITLAQLAQAVPNLATTLADLPSTDYNQVTLSELLTGDNTAYPGYPNPLTLADLLLTTVPPASYPWQSVALTSLPLAANGTAGGDETYTATITVSNPATVQVSVSLPSSFAYVPGSTTLDGDAAADPTSGSPLSWALSLASGTNTLTFEAAAGIDLGPATATLSVSNAGAVLTSSATVGVFDGEEPAIKSPSTAMTLTPGTPDTAPVTQGNLNIGYLTSAGDLNDWRVTIPDGDELSLALSNFPAADQYDLELFGPGVSQLQGSPSQDLSGVNDVLPSITPQATTEQTPGSQDLPVTPPAGDELLALSSNPAGQAQYIQTTPLAGGTYIVQVSGYNGAFSTQPYLLQANLLGGATEPSCPGTGAVQPAISYLNSLGAAATSPAMPPSGVNTLFLVDTQRLTAAFGAPSEASIMSDLESVASGTGSGSGETGVKGAIIPVDSYSSVQNAYSLWNSNPCSVSFANGVVAAIATIVDGIIATNSTVQNVVIVGADDQIPFARIPDGATQANERDYGAATFAGENNPEGDALSLGYYFSDDPYVSNQPLGVGSATLYTPQLAVGRLVESATEIESALTRFMSSNGDLDATTSLTTGYSFLTAGANEVSVNLAANGMTPEALASGINPLIGDTWQESDLDAALANPTPRVISLNAHFDYSRALPGYDNASGLTTHLFTTADVSVPSSGTTPTASYIGTLLFSMGCHSGLDVDDAEVDASIDATSPVADWAKTFADAGALWVGNTGYGYADTDTVAYSAKLMAGFAANLNGSLTIGEALAEAKQQYAAGDAILSPYDLKALMESTLYGLPMYQLNTSPTPATALIQVAPTSGTTNTGTGFTDQLAVSGASGTVSYTQLPGASDLTVTSVGAVSASASLAVGTYTATGTDSDDTSGDVGTWTYTLSVTPDIAPGPTTDLSIAPVTLNLPTGSGTGDLEAVPSANNGTYYELSDAPGGGTQTTEYRPLEPLATLPVTEPGFIPHGALVTGLTSIDTSNFTPTYSMPAVGSADASPPSIGDAAFPGTLQRVSTYGAFTLTGTAEDAQLDLVAGQFLPNPSSPGSGTQRLFTSMSAEVLYQSTGSGLANDYTPATISSSSALDTGTAYNFAVAVTPASSGDAVVQVLVLYTDASSPGSWTPVYLTSGDGLNWSGSGALTSSSKAQYMVEAVDAAGNVSVSNNEGADFNSHDPTTTSLSPSANPAVTGEQVTFTANVAPTVSGLGSPTGSVEFLDAGAPIAACGGASGEAVSDMIATCDVNYNAPGLHQITAAYGGDTNFSSSTTPEPGLAETVNQGAKTSATTTLTSTTSSLTVGQSVTYTATVVGPSGGATPTGSVTFEDRTSAITCVSGDQTLSGLSNSAMATCEVIYGSTSGSPHSITAVYVPGSDPNYNAGSPSNTVTVSVAGVTPTNVVTNSTPTTLGRSVTFTAAVTGPSTAATPTGTVAWMVSGTAGITACTTSATTLSGSGTATCTITVSKAGTYVVSGAYNGDSNYFPVTSGADTVTVAKSPTTTSLNLSASSVTYGNEQTVTFTSKVVPQYLGTAPTGTITVETGSTTLCTITLPASTCTTTAAKLLASPNAYTVTAAYGGDGNYSGSTSSTTITVLFTQACITTDNGTLTVAKGQDICISGKVTGAVSVAAGGALWVSGGSSIGGSLSSTSAVGPIR